MNILDLTQGFSDNEMYKAHKFMGGEVHFKLKPDSDHINSVNWKINTRVNSSDDLMLLIIAIDTLRKDFMGTVEVFMPYMPYAQADRDFAPGESFSLSTVTRILNSLAVDKWHIFDVHSDVAPGMLNRVNRIDNSKFIKWVTREMPEGQTTWLSPDAGAYKKIGKLADTLDWKGEVAAANKYRNTSSGEIDRVELSHEDFKGKDILIIDDICMGGRTFIGLAEKLRTKNVGKIYLAVSHMINEDINPELAKAFDVIFTTNSRHSQYYLSPKRTKLYAPKSKVHVFNLF